MGQPGGEPYDPNAAYQHPPTEQQQYGPQYGPHYNGGQYSGGQYSGGQYGPYYNQQPVPYPAPGYPPPPGYAAYPAPGYQLAGSGLVRPGQATAAAVLSYVAAGLLIAGGILLFVGASVVDDFSTLSNDGHSLLTAELVLDGVLNMVAGGLLIAGAVMFTGGANNGRIMLSVGSGIVLALSIYWIARTGGSATIWALIFAALVIVALAMAWTSANTTWLRTSAKNLVR